MHSPPVEWALGIGYLAVVDWLRDRGEPDGDTLSEVLRAAFSVDQPRGRLALAATLAAGGLVAYRHLTKPESRPHHLTTPT
jgi:hypothetical protein